MPHPVNNGLRWPPSATGGHVVVYTHKDEFNETRLSFEVFGGFLAVRKRGRKGVRCLFFLLFIYLRHDGL